MMPVLHADRVAGGTLFSVRDGTTPLDPQAWALVEGVRLPDGSAARVGVLLRLLDDGQAAFRDPSQVFVPDSSVASLEDEERGWIGLPRSCPLVLELRGTGAFADPDFAIEKRLFHRDGRQVVAPSRDGCFLQVGDDRFVLADPLFDLWESIDRFNSEHASGVEARMLAWAPIAAQLPEEVQLGDELRSVRIILATAFSLSPFENDAGEPDVDPVIGGWREERGGSPEPSRTFEEALPGARQRDFAKHFRELPRVKRRYLAGGGFYIVLSESVERALRVVHEVQRSDAGTRRRFLTRPSAFLRDALQPAEEPGEVGTEDVSVDDVLFDEGFSDRVKGVGVWTPKVLPWLKPSGESWLPEDTGLRIDDELVSVPAEAAFELLERVRAARAEGKATVEDDGRSIPATAETEEALEKILEVTGSGSAPRPKGPSPSSEPTSRLALLIIDNLEQLGFRFTPRAARSATGTTPVSLQTELLEHQQLGLRWLQDHWTSGSPGGLLADDMGLGKTLQALAFLAWVGEEMRAGAWPKRPFLVVAPTGLLRNWRDEHEKHLDGQGIGALVEAFGSGLKALRQRSGTDKAELDSGLPALDVGTLGRSDWVMTTYETLRDYQHSFARVRWGVAVFDEAQKIKNPAAGLTDAAKAMKTDFTVTLTGTPVENRAEDLWCIVDATRPGSLGALKEFSASLEAPAAEGAKPPLVELREKLLEGPPPTTMLRRLKEDHLEGLPAKHMQTHQRPMPPGQADAYSQAILSARSGAPMLQVLQHLRSISLHPTQRTVADDSTFISSSARLELAFEILNDVRSRNEKALIFLESKAVQGALLEILQRRFALRHPVLVINGEVAGASRSARVREFQDRSGFDVMLLSPKAGGVGLTLTAANHVIHLARWWNPAVEDQCTDRVFRIGQTRPVYVHHVMAIHPEYGDRSFDVRLAALLERKRNLNRAVLAPTAASAADFEELFRTTTQA